MISRAKKMPRKKSSPTRGGSSIAKKPVVAHKTFSTITYGDVKASPSGWLDAAPMEAIPMPDFEVELAALVDGYRNVMNKQLVSKALNNQAEQVEKDEGWIYDSVNVKPVTPTLTSISPDTAVIGDADLTLTATGTDFTPQSVITFNGGNENTEFVSDTELTTIVKPSTATTAGAYPVTVKTSTLESDAVDFTFTDPV